MTRQRLFRDTIAVWPNTVHLERAIAVVRDMRGCSRTVLLSPNFFLAHGPSGMRCFFELGIRNVILDLRLLGTPKEIWQCVTEAAKHGVKAISVHAMTGTRPLEIAVEAAKASQLTTLKTQPPRILVSLLPRTLGPAAMIDDLGMRVKRAGHVSAATAAAITAQADGIIAEYEDLKDIRRVSKEIPILVFAQKAAHNYKEVELPVDQAKPSIATLLNAHADHIIFDSTFVERTDVEWASDLIVKELAAIASP